MRAKVLKLLQWSIRWAASQMTFSKIMIACLVYKSVGWIDQSYALAWAGKDDIAESLSTKVVVEVIGVVVVYSVKALTETLSKNNTWPDKTVKSADQEPKTQDSVSSLDADI